jgi:hypothetical protein
MAARSKGVCCLALWFPLAEIEAQDHIRDIQHCTADTAGALLMDLAVTVLGKSEVPSRSRRLNRAKKDGSRETAVVYKYRRAQQHQ